MTLATVDFSSYSESVAAAFEKIDAGKTLSKQSAILIKPNLINATPHPVTTPAVCCEAVIQYIRSCSSAEIVIAEGCGDSVLETDEIFHLLGYRDLATEYAVSLVDLNRASLKKLENNNLVIFPEIYLPEIAFTHFIISLPVLKAHSLATITGTLKNMIGFAPPKYYSGRFGGWKKSFFHNNMQQAIIELNQYRRPDLSLIDASIGLADFHLGGRHCTPAVNKIVAGFNPVEVDRKAAQLLDLDWKQIPHLLQEI
ncbi:MAG: DUF362 domain-containing protein [Desulfobacterales bacterium]|nr:MAG: DUF362 domain-containing protein [Desulfobacterales bacterium]